MQFLTKLIKGILGFITGLLKPKKDAFFLEYKGEAAPAEATQEATTASSTPTLELAISEIAVSEAPANAKAPKATAAKVEKAAAAKKATATVSASAPVSLAAALNLPAPIVTFADIASDPTSGPSISRRRPGANMASFLDMARQASVPVR